MKKETETDPLAHRHSEGCLLFVYGSLKRGYALNHHLSQEVFLNSAVTVPQYRLYDCGHYPALVKVAANGVAVKGELFCVSADAIRKLDFVEGVNTGLYRRSPIQLQDSCARNVDAYIYAESCIGLVDCGKSWPA